MQIIDIATINKKHENPIALALGFFECVHLGHKVIIKNLCELAKKYNATAAITTFINNPHTDKKLINTYSQRLEKFKKQNIGVVLVAEFNQQFKSQSAQSFLQLLIKNFNIKALVCGTDYKFGKDASGNIELLKEFSIKNNIELRILNPIMCADIRVSSTIIRQYLENNQQELANMYLGD